MSGGGKSGFDALGQLGGLAGSAGAGAASQEDLQRAQALSQQGQQSFSGGDQIQSPFMYGYGPQPVVEGKVKVAPIPSPLDAIVHNRPRKLRLNE